MFVVFSAERCFGPLMEYDPFLLGSELFIHVRILIESDVINKNIGIESFAGCHHGESR